ncbi:bZIP transcription factor [Halomarina salina]|uniref:BZIP transcription factor n=1 Tax=Halomarina salina TaxID=1872699 RepID=A0ABD5RK02_9EURY|nr:bZIP transcription factor [Halomarina salina]
MSSGNRVEELESRVKQLEASVTGLTDELVECKERLRALEDEVDPEMDIIEGQTTRDGSETATDVTDTSNSAEENQEESTDSDTDEIIVA